MEESPVNQSYHILHFEDINEAAAFLAALSRFLNDPQGMPYRSQPTLIEVWCQRSLPHETIGVYLSDGAAGAAKAAFTAFPGTRMSNNRILPGDCRLAYQGEQIPL